MLIPMKMTLEDFLQKYASDHQHPTNQKIHSICVPIIFWSIFAFADSISLTQRLSLGHLFGLIALAYYIQFKNLRLTFRMTLVIALCIGTATFIPHVQILAASAFAIADRIIMIYEGKIIAEGTPEEIIHVKGSYTAQFLKQEMGF
jgi:uncharacterized membrane protein YGL010W